MSVAAQHNKDERIDSRLTSMLGGFSGLGCDCLRRDMTASLSTVGTALHSLSAKLWLPTDHLTESRTESQQDVEQVLSCGGAPQSSHTTHDERDDRSQRQSNKVALSLWRIYIDICINIY